jgi:hypothetical protein
MAITRCFVLAGLLVVGSSAHAAPSHRKLAVDAKVPFHADADTKRMLADAEEKAAPEDIADAQQRTSPSGWKLAIGPYVEASSVPVGGWAEIASVRTSITAKAGSLWPASAASYELIGADGAPLSLDARSRVRDQRTTIAGELGFRRKTPELVGAAADVVLAARAALRPTHSLLPAGAFDVGVAGASDSTWPTTLDAGLRVSRTVSLTAGWGSLTTHRLSVITQLRGPRVALQFVF